MTRRILLPLVAALAVLLAVQLMVGFLTEAEPIAAVSPVPCPTPVPEATATPDGGPTYTPTLTHTPCLMKPTSTPTPTPTPTTGLSFDVASSLVGESTTSHAVLVRLSTPGTLAQPVTVDVIDLLTGTAVSGADYAFTTQTVVFPAGSANGDTKSVTLSPLEDFLMESDETVDLGLANAVGQANIVAPSGHTVTIQDNDTPTDTPTPTPTACPTDTLPVGDGCATITPTYTPTPVPSALADLVALGMSITLETGGDCDFTPKLGVRTSFGNTGDADAGPFVVTVNGAQQSVSAGLLQGESGTLWFNGYDPNENSLFVDSSLQVVESNELNNLLVQPPVLPTLPPTCTPTATPIITPTPTKQLDPGDTDGDGCSDQRENGPDETLGGQRDYKNPHDFYDVLGGGGGPPDGFIDLSNDIFGVIQHYAPTGMEPEYDVAFDRGPTAGPNVWNMTPPDGVIDLSNDIFGVIQQFQHDCR